MILVQCHKLMPIHLFRLVERHKPKRLGIPRLILKRPLNRIQIMRSDRHNGPIPAEAPMQFILEVDKSFVGLGREGDVSQDGTDDEGTDLLDLKSTDLLPICRR